MEKLLINHCDKEYMKMAMLKHEETFREQVYELHRLYRIQQVLMKDIAKNRRNNPQSGTSYRDQPEARHLERPAEEFNNPGMESGGKCTRVSGPEDDGSYDLELTLGPKSYHHRKIKAAEPSRSSYSGLSFSSSSSGSKHTKGTRSSTREELLSSQQQKWGPYRIRID